MASLDFEAEKAAFLAAYDNDLALLEDARAAFTALLTALVTHSGSIQVSKITGRVKDREECLRKFSRKYRAALEDSSTPYEIQPYITDLIGIRIVCLYEDELALAADVVRSHFEVIDVSNKVAAVESTASSFGYKGLHMDLRLNATRALLPEYASYARFRFELQVRTVIQDSWSVLDHKIKYKKSIPNTLKRRINVLSALFELADREFRQIRDATELALRDAPDETLSPSLPLELDKLQRLSASGSELNAFTFLKIAQHFFKEFDFEPHKVDSFVQSIREWSPEITRVTFNDLLQQNITSVKKYKQAFEDKNPATKFNAYTVIRHCLYLGDKTKFSRALTKVSRESFDSWLASCAASSPQA
jgi:ppGpp synthetase/RelA/SpoT-type nucleotidyltranferase